MRAEVFMRFDKNGRRYGTGLVFLSSRELWHPKNGDRVKVISAKTDSQKRYLGQEGVVVKGMGFSQYMIAFSNNETYKFSSHLLQKKEAAP
jgi:hypothetical protein